VAERYPPHRLAEIAGLCEVTKPPKQSRARSLRRKRALLVGYNPRFVPGYALRAACFVPPANSQCEMGGGDARGSLAACRASTGADRQ